MSRSLPAWRRFAIAIIILAGSPQWARAGLISGLVVFGDSLSDTGNLFTATGIPPAPYDQGRFSNGPVWVEYLAADLGVPKPTPSLLGGSDYAWGGAQSGYGTTASGIPNTGLQVSTYLASNSPTASQLFTFWAGANDFFNGQTNPMVPVSNIASEISSLAAAGARMFLVPNLPQLGNVPGSLALSQAQRDGLNQLSLGFDSLLHTELAQLRQTWGISIYELDTNDSPVFRRDCQWAAARHRPSSRRNSGPLDETGRGIPHALTWR